KNVISNMADYPDYVFFQVGYLGPSMCPAQVIQDDGIIPGGYKFCDFSVFAIEKSKFDSNFLSNVNSAFVDIQERARNSEVQIDVKEELKSYLASKGAKEVISDIVTMKTVPESSTEQSYTEYYTVDLESVQKKAASTDVERNSLVYLYIIIPVVALFIILFLVIKKRQK
ncbi:MAG: hypothetical protein QW404_02525, partial [Candidatus Nanoarchaeia archaeon]